MKKDETENGKLNINDKNYLSTSKLEKPIQNIIRLIFDIESMKRQMKEFEVNWNWICHRFDVVWKKFLILDWFEQNASWKNFFQSN